MHKFKLQKEYSPSHSLCWVDDVTKLTWRDIKTQKWRQTYDAKWFLC